MFRVAYSREYDTRLYRVTLFAIDQTIVLHADILIEKIGMNSRCEVGCQDVPVNVIIELGFIFPSKNARLIV